MAGVGRRTESLPQARLQNGLATAAVLLAMVASGCSDDGGAASGTTTTTLPRSTTTTEVQRTVEEEVTERYLAFWEARFEANTEPVNPDHAGLRKYATGEQLANVVEQTRRNALEGRAFRLPKNSQGRRSVQVLQIEGDTAVLQDCVVNDGVVYRVDTGEVIDDSVVTHSVEATMTRVDGDWKLERAELVQQWEGVAGCALSADF